jgi:hypothetical protein
MARLARAIQLASVREPIESYVRLDGPLLRAMTLSPEWMLLSTDPSAIQDALTMPVIDPLPVLPSVSIA